jgi:UPF0176 protein
MKVASFYRFIDIADPEGFATGLAQRCRDGDLLGTVLVAEEGLNGTLAGDEAGIRATLDWIVASLTLDSPMDARWTDSAEAPFRRLRVRVKPEIVTLGRPDIRPQHGPARHVAPADWNALIDHPGMLVIDVRNHYEYEVGTFPRAVDPQTDSFREFAAFADRLAKESTDRAVAMFCTGGIRCEKAGALMRGLGFKDVYQLEGGILNYLEQVPAAENRWHGECFIFDTRVALDRDLAEGGYVQCHACRRPLSTEDLASPEYRPGVSCPKCIGSLAPERALRLEERAKQIALAEARGEKHLGPAGMPGQKRPVE